MARDGGKSAKTHDAFGIVAQGAVGARGLAYMAHGTSEAELKSSLFHVPRCGNCDSARDVQVSRASNALAHSALQVTYC